MFSSSMSTTLLALYLTFEILNVFGELTILTELKEKVYSRVDRPTMCISEYDGGALVWNNDLDSNLPLQKIAVQKFSKLPSSTGHAIDCSFSSLENCASSWTFNGSHWHIARSDEKAMGPVLDKRWEDFSETMFKEGSDFERVQAELKTKSAVVFSVRGKNDAHLLLCKEEDFHGGPCYWIIIGGWKNKKSAIRQCDHGVPKSLEEPPPSSTECRKLRKEYNHTSKPPLSMMEWRTFVLKWNDQDRTISVFDQTERFLHFQFSEWNPISHLFVRSSAPALFRFHIYSYFHTTKSNERLLSSNWSQIEADFCMEMSVGLCSGCELKINVINANQKRQHIKTVSSQLNPVGHGLPTWQFVKLNTNLEVEFRNDIQLEMITSLPHNGRSPFWAVSSVQKCLSADAVRKSEITVLQDWVGDIKSWTNITCQKLSNNGSFVVGISSNAVGDAAKNLPLCPKGKVGPHCAISCNEVGKDKDCKMLSICRETGCVCSYGYQGSECIDDPKSISNLQIKNDTDRKVTVKWDLDPNEKYIEYVIVWKVILFKGCQDRNKSMPEQKPISITVNTNRARLPELHPYAKYGVTVIVYTPNRSESSKVIYFETQPSELPTTVIVNLRFEGDTLMWDYPTDCTTITGPMTATELIFNGISDHVRNFTITTKTTARSFKLDEQNGSFYGATRYRVRAYVSKKSNPTHHNEIAYSELNFTTKPRAPPSVEDLVVYEFDSHEKKVSLRWLPPRPPRNGDLESYSVSFCDHKPESRDHIVVLVNSTCKLWDNYVCATLNATDCSNIFVWANNKNVSVHGEIRNVSYTMQEEAPEEPTNVTAIQLGNGMVKLTWLHPWRTHGKLIKFHINISGVSTDLKKNESLENLSGNSQILVHDYHREYSEQLSLLPSTKYELCIVAETRGVNGSCKVERILTRAAMAFENTILKEVVRIGTTIVIALPSVLNDVKGSTMHVIVKGSTLCEPHSELRTDLIKYANVTNDQVAWKAVSFSNGIDKNKTFTIGNNETYGEAWNCPLKPAETYEIVVVVQGGQEITENQTIAISTLPLYGESGTFSSVWLAVTFPTAAIVALIIFIGHRCSIIPTGSMRCYRKRAVISQNSETHRDIPLIQRFANLRQVPYERYDSISHRPPLPIPEGSSSSTIIYDTPLENEHTNTVLIEEFEYYVKRAFDSGMLQEQYKMFPKDQTKPWGYGYVSENRRKNRYSDIIAYDETRVKLREISDVTYSEPFSDYINANYIHGYDKEKAYIATQGPLPDTVIDFWRMIWQENALVICMLVNVTEVLQKKCEQYWPEIGEKKKYGEVIVWNVSQSIFADYTYRIFEITVGQESRQINHLHYTAWSELEEPTHTYSVVGYLKKLLATPRGNGPVVVHCSSGVGRTGTIILCAICLRGAALDKGICMFEETKVIYSQRVNMITNKEQYFLAHLVVAECLSAPSTATPCSNDWPKRIKEMKKQLSVQRQRLCDIAWQDRMLQFTVINMPLSKRCLEKNRFPILTPGREDSGYLDNYPIDDVDSDYISAVHVDGVTKRNQYLATQLPLPTTIKDFWRLVAKLKIELVVILQDPNLENETCCEVMPRIGVIKPVPNMKARVITTEDFKHFSSQKLVLSDKSEVLRRTQPVTILKCKGWQSGKNGEPPSTDTLVSLWMASEEISRGEGPTIVLCYDGVTGCGLYLALSFLLEKMVVEGECDVYSAVRAVRRSRPQFVQTLEQFEYLYNAAATYSECHRKIVKYD